MFRIIRARSHPISFERVHHRYVYPIRDPADAARSFARGILRNGGRVRELYYSNLEMCREYHLEDFKAEQASLGLNIPVSILEVDTLCKGGRFKIDDWDPTPLTPLERVIVESFRDNERFGALDTLIHLGKENYNTDTPYWDQFVALVKKFFLSGGDTSQVTHAKVKIYARRPRDDIYNSFVMEKPEDLLHVPLRLLERKTPDEFTIPYDRSDYPDLTDFEHCFVRAYRDVDIFCTISLLCRHVPCNDSLGFHPHPSPSIGADAPDRLFSFLVWLRRIFFDPPISSYKLTEEEWTAKILARQTP
jgi:hypothetical protein